MALLWDTLQFMTIFSVQCLTAQTRKVGEQATVPLVSFDAKVRRGYYYLRVDQIPPNFSTEVDEHPSWEGLYLYLYDHLEGGHALVRSKAHLGASEN